MGAHGAHTAHTSLHCSLLPTEHIDFANFRNIDTIVGVAVMVDVDEGVLNDLQMQLPEADVRRKTICAGISVKRRLRNNTGSSFGYDHVLNMIIAERMS